MNTRTLGHIITTVIATALVRMDSFGRLDRLIGYHLKTVEDEDPYPTPRRGKPIQNNLAEFLPKLARHTRKPHKQGLVDTSADEPTGCPTLPLIPVTTSEVDFSIRAPQEIQLRLVLMVSSP